MQGYYEGQLAQLTKRHQQRQRRRKGPDERTIITGQRLPEPGAGHASCSLAQLPQTLRRAYMCIWGCLSDISARPPCCKGCVR